MSLWKDEDRNWDNDIRFSSRDVFEEEAYPDKHDWFSSDPDRNLASALAKVAYDEDDDNQTESVFMCNHSDKLTVDENDTLRIPGLDDYMLQQPSSLGTITRLGTHRRTQDAGDWCEDIEFPLKGLIREHKLRQRQQQQQQQHAPMSAPSNDSDVFSLLDADEEEEEKRKEHADTSATVRHVRFDQTDRVRPLPSPEPDQVNFDDIAFPDDMDLKLAPFKVETKEKTKLYRETEDDENDFCKDLDIKDDSVFHLHAHGNKENEKKTQPARTIPTNNINTNTTTSSSKASGIPRRIPPPKPVERKFWSLPSRQQRFRAPTYASRQKEIMPPPTPPQRPRTDTTKGTTLMARPRSHTAYGNGSELDSLDNLPEWKRSLLRRPAPLRRPTTALSKIPTALGRNPVTAAATGATGNSSSNSNNNITINAGNNNVDPQRPWRHNMTRRKPTLIQPSEHFDKQVNNMRYDPVAQRWQGNEQSLAPFESNGSPSRQQQQQQQQQPQRRRPALISNLQKNGKSKYTELARGDMVFDPIRMRWHKTQQSEEDHSLDHLEDLDPRVVPSLSPRPTESSEPKVQQTQQQQDAGPPKQHTYREFTFSRERQRHMHVQEEQHRAAMQPWEHALVRPSPYLFYDGSDDEV